MSFGNVLRIACAIRAVPIDVEGDSNCRYVLEEEVGGGGMGVVFRARDLNLKRSLAIKVLRERYRGHAELIQRFVEEVQLTGQLQHPGIPPIHEIGKLADGRPFFAMKFIKGDTLASQR